MRMSEGIPPRWHFFVLGRQVLRGSVLLRCRALDRLLLRQSRIRVEISMTLGGDGLIQKINTGHYESMFDFICTYRVGSNPGLPLKTSIRGHEDFVDPSEHVLPRVGGTDCSPIVSVCNSPSTYRNPMHCHAQLINAGSLAG
jgi:hypothetical protein